ncbi:hypothetical protein BDR26DRAFT_891382 [Obelidium mucronatum]|nr:hypothetical protein BDR26DRAFT_891382 [Obelidium mucronatum]
MRLVTQLTHLPLDALASIAVLLHPHTLHALSCTSKSMKLAIESLQQANWFALQNLRHAISEIEKKLIKSHGIRSFDREISEEEALGGFMPAWQHSFWQEHMYKVQFSKLPVSYTIALLKADWVQLRLVGGPGCPLSVSKSHAD